MLYVAGVIQDFEVEGGIRKVTRKYCYCYLNTPAMYLSYDTCVGIPIL